MNDVHACNTELEIEIRGMKERFREMSSGDPFAARNNILREVIADSVGDSPDRNNTGRKPFEPEETAKPKDEALAAIEQFEKVWRMPDDDEEESGFLTTIPGSLDSFSPKPGQPKSRVYNSSSETSLRAEDFWYSVTRPSKKFCSFLTSIISASHGNGFSKPG